MNRRWSGWKTLAQLNCGPPLIHHDRSVIQRGGHVSVGPMASNHRQAIPGNLLDLPNQGICLTGGCCCGGMHWVEVLIDFWIRIPIHGGSSQRRSFTQLLHVYTTIWAWKILKSVARTFFLGALLRFCRFWSWREHGFGYSPNGWGDVVLSSPVPLL